MRFARTRQSKHRWRLIAWRVLNSAFVLWFLSSVVLALLASLWGRHNEAIHVQAARSARLSALRLEITRRIVSTGGSSGALKTQLTTEVTSSDGMPEWLTLSTILQSAGITSVPSRGSEGAPEFATQPLASLVYEYATLEPTLLPQGRRLVARLQSLAAAMKGFEIRSAETNADRKYFVVFALYRLHTLAGEARDFVDQDYITAASVVVREDAAEFEALRAHGLKLPLTERPQPRGDIPADISR